MCREAELLRLCPFDGHVQIRLIEGLLHAEIYDAGDRTDLSENLVRPHAISLKIVADHLNVDGSRQPEVENLRDHVGGQKGEGHSGEFFRQRKAKLFYVVVSWVMLG